MTNSKTGKGTIRRWIENSLLLAGVVGLSLWAGANAAPVIWQDWGNWVFDRQIRGEAATIAGYLAAKEAEIARRVEAWLGRAPAAKLSVPSPRSVSPPVQRPSVGENDLVGRLAIPRLHVSAIVREGVGRNTLGLAVGHIPGTALPGQTGNVGVAGHRDTLFRGLREIRANDLIQFETLAGRYLYEVGSTQVVKPQNISVLKPGQYSELTLVTCYPFNYIGSAPDRFIVKARQVSEIESGISRPGDEPATAPQEAVEKRADHVDQTANRQAAAKRDRAAGKIDFVVAKNHSRQLTPGISLGVDQIDLTRQRVNGWMWIMPDRRTIWLRDQGTRDPVVFYGYRDGKRRELVITNVAKSSAAGYLLQPEE
jgi:sortase A